MLLSFSHRLWLKLHQTTVSGSKPHAKVKSQRAVLALKVRVKKSASAMAPSRSGGIIRFVCLVLLLLQLELSLTIRIDDRTRLAAPNATATELGYRVSRPEPKQPTKRVPAHLQDIRPGYVDDDAGDVIRIIEPPQHFQQLKRLRQRQPQPVHAANAPPQKAVVWEQPRKLSKNPAPHQPPRQPLHQAPQQLPHHPAQRSHAQTQLLPRPKMTVAPPPPNADLLTQETQHSAQLYNGLQLPMEILASVRKTERLLQGQRQQMPQVRQRHIQRQTHTLIAQKALEQQNYQREQQHRLRATLSQDHKRSKRVKRETGSNYGVAQGLKLVAHIGELLQNATLYLPDEAEPNDLVPKASPLTSAAASASQFCGNATNCDTRRRRQRLFQQGSKKIAVRGRNFRHEATATTAATTAQTNARHITTKQATTTTQATSSSTTSATPLASRLVNSRKSPNNRNQHQHQLQLPAAPRHDDSVLYADVMSNIRNLWQEHDLVGAPQFVAPAQVANNTDYRALNVYLHELDQLAKSLSTAAPLPSLNQQEFARATPPPSWYLINNEGKIYETRLDSETKPTVALFHQFPDLPDEYEPVTTQDLE